MLAQAEHDELAASICITTSRVHAAAIALAVERQCRELSRATIAARSLESFGTILVVKTLERAAELSNQIAPEHLEVMTRSPRLLLPLLKNAGAIFLGAFFGRRLGSAGVCGFSFHRMNKAMYPAARSAEKRETISSTGSPTRAAPIQRSQTPAPC